MKLLLKIVGVVVGLFVVLVVALFVSTFSGRKPIAEGQVVDGVYVVKDGIVSAGVVDIGPGEVALIDAGNDPTGKAILAELAKRNLGPAAVKAIFLTHGHRDHIAAAPLFPDAQ